MLLFLVASIVLVVLVAIALAHVLYLVGYSCRFYCCLKK